MRRLVLGFLAALMAAFLVVPQAEAQTTPMVWKFKAFHNNIVDVELYSQNRKHFWPGGGKVWSIKNFNAQNMRITCVAGEKICYGAWVRGSQSSYWGVGRGGKARCTNCCYTCGTTGETPLINLNAR